MLAKLRKTFALCAGVAFSFIAISAAAQIDTRAKCSPIFTQSTVSGSVVVLCGDDRPELEAMARSLNQIVSAGRLERREVSKLAEDLNDVLGLRHAMDQLNIKLDRIEENTNILVVQNGDQAKSAQQPSGGGSPQSSTPQTPCYVKTQSGNETCEAILAEPSNETNRFNALSTRGTIEFGARNLVSALKDFRETETLRPNSAISHNNVAVILCSLKQFEDCNAEFDKAMAISPTYNFAVLNAAQWMLRQKNYQKAIYLYTISLSLNQKQIAPLIGRGEAYDETGQYKDGLADLDEAYKIDPHNANMLNDRCFGRALANVNLPGAILDCAEAVRIRSNNQNNLDSNGFIFFRLGRYEEAIKFYDMALRINPAYPSSLFMKGQIEKRLGEIQQGEADIQRAQQLDPKIQSVYRRITF